MDDAVGFLSGEKIDAGDAGKIKSAHIAFLDAWVEFMTEYG